MMKNRHSQLGFNLVELMVAMVIGVFLIGGALQVYIQSQAALHVSDSTARMQETARFAMSTIEQDVRAVDLWGLTNIPTDINGRADQADPVAINVQQSCDVNWAVNLESGIIGSNNANPYPGTCIPNAQYVGGSDVLVLRHTEEDTVDEVDLRPGVIYVRSNNTTGTVFVGTAQPTTVSTDAINSELTSVVYWVSPTSDNDANTPSLRRAFLTTTGAAPIVDSEEVISGVEDLQVQYGVDLNGNGSVDSYLDFDNVANPAQVMVARVWLRVRTENTEVGFTDNATFVYADGVYSAADAEALNPSPAGTPALTSFRRLLLTKTIEIRNRRG